jgi:hypothetical protein
MTRKASRDQANEPSRDEKRTAPVLCARSLARVASERPGIRGAPQIDDHHGASPGWRYLKMAE